MYAENANRNFQNILTFSSDVLVSVLLISVLLSYDKNYTVITLAAHGSLDSVLRNLGSVSNQERAANSAVESFLTSPTIPGFFFNL